MQEKETYTLAEAARILGVSRATLQRHAENGKVPAIRLVRRVLIPKAYVDQLFDAAGYPRVGASRPFLKKNVLIGMKFLEKFACL